MSPARRRILVVDDSLIMRRLVTEIVESDPELEVVGTAVNGKEALRQLRVLKPELILLDIEMPEMSGLETLRRLGLRSPVKVVILSSLVSSEDATERLEAMRLGASACIGKPSGAVSMDIVAARGGEVVRAVRTVLGMPVIAEAPPGTRRRQDRTDGAAISGESLPVIAEALLRASPVGVLIFGADGRLLQPANAAARTLLRLPETPTGTLVADILGDFNGPTIEAIWETLRSDTARPTEATEIAAADGDWLPLRLAFQPMRFGRQPACMMLLEDRGRESQLEAALTRVLPAGAGIEDLSPDTGGTLQQATILFSDIRGYTGLSERLGPVGIITLLNDYFSFMADVIRDCGGGIDKYIGDAIMALFGPPAPREGDAARAIEASRRMLDALALFNNRRPPGDPKVAIGIGLGSGEVVAGRIGSPDRMNYTVIGDAVNLSARLESLTKTYGAAILACGPTRRAAPDAPGRRLDVVRVKGQSTPTEIHEIFQTAPGPDAATWLAAYEAALRHYISGAFTDAMHGFSAVVANRPTDTAAELLRGRCAMLAANPPPEWDGVFTLTEK